MNKIVIKIGSRVLTKKNGNLNKSAIANLVKQVAELKKRDYKVLLVSSGAVSSGRIAKELQGNFKIEASGQNKRIIREQVLAAVGQPELMFFYVKEFRKYNIRCAQGLVTRSDFSDRERYLNLRTVTKNLISLGIVPILNENDFLSSEELSFSDNDQLACMASAMLGAHLLIILTDVPGVLEVKKGKITNKAMPEITNINEMINKIKPAKSDIGRGGMKSKLLSAKLVTSLGIPLYIVSGFEKNAIVDIVLKNKKIGTYFPVHGKKQPSLKAWIATAANCKGEIVVSTYLADILQQKRIASILLSGIEKVKGNFNKGDVVRICCDERGRELGRGQVRYNSSDLIKKIDKYKQNLSANQKIVGGGKIAVHYNNFIFSE